MADLEVALVTRLEADAGVAAITTAVRPLVADANQRPPFVVYRRMSSVRAQAFQAAPGNVAARMEFTCVAATPAAARSLAGAVRSSLHRHKAPAGSPVIQDIMLEAEEDEIGNAKDQRFQVVLEFLVYYLES